MPSLLFVCTANHYRSPIAAAKFKTILLKKGWQGMWNVESAGTWTDPGLPVAPRAKRLARHCGLDLGSHKTCLVSTDQLERSNLVLVMEKGHKEALLAEFPSATGRVFLLSEIVDEVQYSIPDPAGSPEHAEEIVLELCNLIERGFEKICESVETTYRTNQRHLTVRDNLCREN